MEELDHLELELPELQNSGSRSDCMQGSFESELPVPEEPQELVDLQEPVASQ